LDRLFSCPSPFLAHLRIAKRKVFPVIEKYNPNNGTTRVLSKPVSPGWSLRVELILHASSVLSALQPTFLDLVLSPLLKWAFNSNDGPGLDRAPHFHFLCCVCGPNIDSSCHRDSNRVGAVGIGAREDLTILKLLFGCQMFNS